MPLDPLEPARPKWYHNIWFVLAMLLFVLGPFGLPLVWKNPRLSRPVKAALTAGMALYTLLLVDALLSAVRIVLEHVNQLP